MKIHKDEIDAALDKLHPCFHIMSGDYEEHTRNALEAAYTVRRARKASKRERQRKALIDNDEIGQFKPCVVEYEEARITEIVLEDCFTVWVPHEGLELGYNNEGKLIAVKVYGLVAERQRKEKDKQVVESVKPLAGFFAALTPEQREKAINFKGNEFVGELDALMGIEANRDAPPVAESEWMIEARKKREPTPSKAPEWDGTFGCGQWETRGGELAVVSEANGSKLHGCIQSVDRICRMVWNADGCVRPMPPSGDDLIRPWPKGEQ